MAIQKRHIVYLSNEEWGAAQREAKACGTTTSELIRDSLRRACGSQVEPDTDPAERLFTPVPKPTRRK